MTATEYHVDGRVEVRYYSHHTNHQPDVRECRNLPLPTSVKEDIQQQFAAGITIEQIMDSMLIYVYIIQQSAHIKYIHKWTFPHHRYQGHFGEQK